MCLCKNETCWLNGKFLEEDVVSKSKVQVDASRDIRTAQMPQKTLLRLVFIRIGIHLNTQKNRTATSLAKHVWQFKEKEMRHFNKFWETIDKAVAYRRGHHTHKKKR